MTPVASLAPITANGEYSLEPLDNGDEVLLEWEITAGSATVTPGRVSIAGNFSPALPLDGVPPVFEAAGGSCVITLGASSKVALKVESAAGLQMKACQSVVRRS